jgi:hypothetical protein
MNFVSVFMHLVDAGSAWLTRIGLQGVVDQHAWIVPACQTIHFLGLSMLMAGIGLFDLRTLGMGKGLAIAPLFGRLMPFAIIGLFINTVTGLLLYAAAPDMFGHNVAFGFKMLFLALAGVNALLYSVTGVKRKVEALGPNDDAPTSAKVMCAASLFLWVGVMFWGRMLPFIGNAF